MSWHFVERWLQKVNQHSTLIGKFWITFLIVFRIVVVSSVSDRVYSDEQSEFKCNTMQVGCPNVCFNNFSPISHIRFWSFQIILVTTPSIIFMVYSAHQIKKKPHKDKSPSSGPTPSPTKKPEGSNFDQQQGEEDDKRRKSLKGRPSSLDTKNLNGQIPSKRKIKQMVIQEMFGEEKVAFSQHYVLYAISVSARTAIECAFIYLQYRMFGFEIPELYKCNGDPCPNTVDCFVSRPMEKTVFLWFMFIIAVICATLNAMELVYLFWQFGIKRVRLEKKKRNSLMANRSMSEKQRAELADAEILDGGVLSLQTAPPPEYRGVFKNPTDGIEFLHNDRQRCNLNPLTTSFSLDDGFLKDPPAPRGPWYPGQPGQSSGLSYSQRSAHLHPVEVTLSDQP